MKNYTVRDLAQIALVAALYVHDCPRIAYYKQNTILLELVDNWFG